MRTLILIGVILHIVWCCSPTVSADDIARPAVEGQPLAANVQRLLSTLEMLGADLDEQTAGLLQAAIASRDASALQSLLDPHVLLVVSINPELRVTLARGPAPARIQQHGFTPLVVKVLNEGAVDGRLNIHSPQAGNVFDGASDFSLQRQQQTGLNSDPNADKSSDRFLSVEMFRNPGFKAPRESSPKQSDCLTLRICRASRALHTLLNTQPFE